MVHPQLIPNHTMSDYVCEDLIGEILGRLQPKSLVRFRSLSKTWDSRIASPGFIRMHALRSVKAPRKVVVRKKVHYKKDCNVISYTLHPEDQYTGENLVNFSSYNIRIGGSCNGILCLIKNRISVILWNPSIGRQLTVPNPPTRLAIGFGFDPITNDYKIVGIPYPKYERVAQKSFVYSVNSNSWNEFASPTIPCSSIQVVSLACFVNGALHFVVKSESDNIVHYYIMTFDLHTNIFGMISLPEPSWLTRVLTIIDGSLAVISNEGDNVWIWVRREYNNVSSWSKAFNLKTRGGFEGADKVFFLNNYAKGFEAYNPETGIRSTLQIFPDSSFKVEMDVCVESLELLHGDMFDKSYISKDV